MLAFGGSEITAIKNVRFEGRGRVPPARFVGGVTGVKGMKKWIFKRLREPSSWAGLGALALAAGANVEQVQAVGQIGAGIFALLAIGIGERGGAA